jgi:hypothetical protein
VPRRRSHPWLVLVVALVAVAACGEDETSTSTGPGDGSTPPTTSAEASEPGEQRYEGSGTVLESPEHGPQLCSGVEDSLPPQCSGIELIGWSWDEADGEEAASGTTWGDFSVVGTWDGTALTLTEPPGEPVPYDREAANAEWQALAETPCDEPEGGWQVVDPATTTDAAMRAAGEYARQQPDVGTTWIDQTYEAGDGSEGNAMGDPELLTYNATFTGDLERHEAAMREIWGGRLCVSEATITATELVAIRHAVEAEIDFTWSALDEIGGRVELGVTVDDGLTEQLEAEHGEGRILLVPQLTPVEG